MQHRKYVKSILGVKDYIIRNQPINEDEEEDKEVEYEPGLFQEVQRKKTQQAMQGYVRGITNGS